MIGQIAKITIGVVVGLFGLVNPGYSGPVTAFGFSGSTNGSVTLNSAGDVTAISGVVFNMFVAGGADAFATTLSEAAGSQTIVVKANEAFTGTVNGITYNNISNGETLLTINLLSAVTSLVDANPLGQGLMVNFASAAVSSVVVDPNLLADFGYSSQQVADALTSGSLQGAGPTIAGSNTLNSNTMGDTLSAVPEPVSFVLFGSGFLCVGLLARRKSSRK